MMYFKYIVIVRSTSFKMNFCVRNIKYDIAIILYCMYMIAYGVYCLYIFRADT